MELVKIRKASKRAQRPSTFLTSQSGFSRSGEPNDKHLSEREQEEKEEISTDSDEMTSVDDIREDQALVKEKPKITAVLLLTAFGISTGSFQYGYNLSVLNNPFEILQTFINETNYKTSEEYLSMDTVRIYWSAIVSVFALGGMFGACAVGWWSLSFGRKRGCLANTVFGFTGIVVMVISPSVPSYHTLLVGRLLMGIHSGLYTGLCPLYLNEISTPTTRGPLGVVQQIGTVLGLLVAQVLGFPILLGTSQLWVVLLGFASVPLLLQIMVLSCCPESPRFLATTCSDIDTTRQALRRLRGTSNVEDELLKLTDDKETTIKEKSCWELLGMQRHRTGLLLAILIMMSPHLAGSIAVVFYSSMMFKEIGQSPTEAMYATSGLGVTMVVMAVLSIWLVNRAGRRFLLLLGLAVMGVSSVAIVLLSEFQEKEALIGAVIALILGLAIGPGPIAFTVVPELFPPDVKRSALAVSIPFNWLANFGVGLTFPALLANLEHLTFAVFAVAAFLIYLILYSLLPETRPGPLENLTFTYEGEDFGQAARASVSIDVYSSHSDGSKENNIAERLRQGFSKSAILGHNFERQHSIKSQKFKSHGDDMLYDPLYFDKARGRKLQRAFSDGGYGQVYYPSDLSSDRQHLPDSRKKNQDCEKIDDYCRERPATSRTSGVSSMLGRSYIGDLEFSSGNSGLTSLMDTSTSSEWTRSGMLGDAQGSLIRDMGSGPFGSNDHKKRRETERKRHSSQRQSVSSFVYGTWSDHSCDADVEGD